MKKLLIAFLNRSQVPSRQAIQEAIKSLRFKLTVDESYVPLESSGYIPCTLDGEDAGFEIKFGDGSEYLGDMPALQSQIGDRDTALALRWGGDPRERVSAMIIAAALAQRFGALVHCQGDGAFPPSDQLLTEARAAFARLQEQ